MNLFLRLAWRNIWRHRRRTVIVVSAISFTLAMVMLYDGMIAGFEDAIYGNAIKVLGGNIQIHAEGYQAKGGQNPLLPLPDDQAAVKAALSQPQVVAASRRINTSGLATNRKGAFAVGITGMEPEQELPVNLIAQNVFEGRYLAADDQDMVLIGKGLADVMELKVGDRFSLSGRAPHQQIITRTMTVVGIYDIGMAEIEKRSVFLSLANAQDLYGSEWPVHRGCGRAETNRPGTRGDECHPARPAWLRDGLLANQLSRAAKRHPNQGWCDENL